MGNKLNPWKILTLNNNIYTILCKDYSLRPHNTKLENNPIFVRRNLIVGQDNFSFWLKKAKSKKKVALVSGFMTSGFLHLGSLTIIKQMAYYQKEYGAKIIIPIADLEAICVRKTNPKKIKSFLIDFIAHFLAEGISPKDTKIYLQTNNLDILRKAALFTSKIDFSDLEKIYERNLTFGESFSSLVMTADILSPQEKGYEATLVILGIDEICHFALAKKLISKLGKEFYSPSITYNKILTGLNGSKMGKSIAKNSVLLSDKPEIAKQKLLKLKNKCTKLPQNPGFNILEGYCEDDSLIKRITEIPNEKDANNLAIEEASKVVFSLLRKHQRNYKRFLPKARKIAEEVTKQNENN